MSQSNLPISTLKLSENVTVRCCQVPSVLTQPIRHLISNEKYWTEIIKQVYTGDEGRKKLRPSAICLLERNDLGAKLKEISCPTLILHRTEAIVYSITIGKKGQNELINANPCELEIIDHGQYYLSASHPNEINKFIIDFIKKKFQNSKLIMHRK